MAWFKVDDALAFHMKAFTAGNAAMGLWVRAGSWSGQQLSDGFIPSAIVSALGGTWDDSASLVNAGLWHQAEGGFQFHDWAEYQPTREDVLADRAAAAERMRRVRANKKPNVPANERDAFGRGSASPSRPVPTRPEDSNFLSQSNVSSDADSTDAGIERSTERTAAAFGITSLEAIRDVIEKHTGRRLDGREAFAVARWLLGKAKGEPKVPQRYVIRAVSLSPAEVQKHIDEAVLP